MTQEIYNYLLTREKIINLSLEELITETKNNDNFPDTIKLIYKIVARENILLIKNEYYEKVEKYLQEFRFSYIKDNELNVYMNYIILALNNYKQLSIGERTDYIIDWKTLEACNRYIPNSWTISLDEVLSYVLLDSKYLKQLLEKNISLDNPKELLSSFNVLCIQFTEIFEENRECLNLTIEIAKNIKNTTTDRKIKRMAKCYLNHAEYTVEEYHKYKQKKKQL